MNLERAIEIAFEVHDGSVDKAGEPYIHHVLRVVGSPRLRHDDEMMAAALHDVIEDSGDWTLERLIEEGFREAIVIAVDALTRRSNETYTDFVMRAAADPIAGLVKLADLDDNMNLSRIEAPGPRDQARTEKYRKAADLIVRALASA